MDRKRSRTVANSAIEFDKADFLRLHENIGVTEDSMILGIDEAGRGPAVGDMVYCGGMISLRHHDELLDAGVADSKTLSDKNRESIAQKLKTIPTFTAIQRNVTATDISDCMTGRTGQSLNTLSHQTAIDIIVTATLLADGKLCAVYVDTVGNPGTYAATLRGRFPHLRVTVTSKADSKFPIVSAASIVAKSERERNVDELHAKGYDIGSGYPGDERCVAWYRTSLHRFFGYTHRDAAHVRMAWSPCVAAMEAACVPIQFEYQKEQYDDGKGGGAEKGAQRPAAQPLLNFSTKLPPKRDAIFTFSLGLTPSRDL